MNSGKSASIQSSSTGGGGSQGGGSREDQELESHDGETISALLNPTTSLPSFYNTCSLPAYYHHHHQLPNYRFDTPPFSQSMMINHNNTNNNNSNFIGNDGCGGGDINNSLGMVWPNKYTLLEPSPINNVDDDTNNNCTTSTSTSTSSVTNQQQQMNTCVTQSHPLLERPPLPVPTSMDSTSLVIKTCSPGSLNQHGRSNPKKRSRASRRTPTTVLTTDTNNFRQMVQEFTGIPASPFETAFAGRPRLDLFAGFGIQLPRDVCSSTTQPPHHLIKPFPQKILVPPYPINHLPNNITTTNSTPSLFHPRPPSHVPLTGFQPGDPTTSLGSNPTDSLMNDFALGHNNNNISTTTTATTRATTTIGLLQVNEGSGGNNNVTTHPTIDSWICSSDS